MRALLLERHDWETSGAEHQIQIPKAAFAQFFVTTGPRNIQLLQPQSASPGQAQSVLLSYYKESDTYRFNWMTEFGSLGHAVIVFEEMRRASGSYLVWWFTGPDAEAALARSYPWQQAKSSQHGPGRKWVVVSAPAPRTP